MADAPSFNKVLKYQAIEAIVHKYDIHITPRPRKNAARQDARFSCQPQLSPGSWRRHRQDDILRKTSKLQQDPPAPILHNFTIWMVYTILKFCFTNSIPVGSEMLSL